MSKKVIAEKYDSQIRANRFRIAAIGSFRSRVLGTAVIVLLASGFGTAVSNRVTKRVAHPLCNPHKTSLAITNESRPESPVIEEVGLRLGQRAPSFTLKDQNEREVSLGSLLQKGSVVLVFYRSADWCPFCKQQLVELERNLKEIKAAGTQLVGISYDSVPILKRFATNRISFTLLSDSGSRTIDAYNIRDKNVNDGVARHATFIVDKNGVVRTKLFQVSYAERPALDELLTAIREAQ